MASSLDDLIQEVVIDLNSKNGLSLSLKPEQKEAIKSLLQGLDVLAVLPTGFGKSLIFQLYVLVKAKLQQSGVVLVVSPLSSLIKDQIREGRSLGLDCVALGEGQLSGKEQVIFASAEDIISKSFRKAVEIHKKIAVVVVDESHTVETWTGNR